MKQLKLKKNQISAFYHDEFVQSQVSDFVSLTKKFIHSNCKTLLDVGGGRGYFAQSIQSKLNIKTTVFDNDNESVVFCRNLGIDAIKGNALNPKIEKKYDVICFNLFLHHLVGKSNKETLRIQSHVLKTWGLQTNVFFVNEYIYESFFLSELSSFLIFKITNSPILSKIASYFAKIFPSLNANTFGVGVRFRSHLAWVSLFKSLGFEVISSTKGLNEHISLPRRFLLIKSCRRDSFLLTKL